MEPRKTYEILPRAQGSGWTLCTTGFVGLHNATFAMAPNNRETNLKNRRESHVIGHGSVAGRM